MQFFRKLAIVSTGATILLIAIGGLVRATKSGLGCGTDWPHCAGKLVPALETRAEIIEFSHRAAASVVVVLLGLLAVTAYPEPEGLSPLRRSLDRRVRPGDVPGGPRARSS